MKFFSTPNIILFSVLVSIFCTVSCINDEKLSVEIDQKVAEIQNSVINGKFQAKQVKLKHAGRKISGYYRDDTLFLLQIQSEGAGHDFFFDKGKLIYAFADFRGQQASNYRIYYHNEHARIVFDNSEKVEKSAQKELIEAKFRRNLYFFKKTLDNKQKLDSLDSLKTVLPDYVLKYVNKPVKHLLADSAFNVRLHIVVPDETDFTDLRRLLENEFNVVRLRNNTLIVGKARDKKSDYDGLIVVNLKLNYLSASITNKMGHVKNIYSEGNIESLPDTLKRWLHSYYIKKGSATK